MITVLFDGVAYGSLLFLISVGLSVTLGLLNFINLAHGAFAMFGGYLSVALSARLGLPFLATLPVVFCVLGLAGALLERLLYRRLYGASHLDQVLFSIGLVFMAGAIATYFWGPGQQRVELPAALRGQIRWLGVELGSYRLLLIALVLAISLFLRWLVAHTRFGAQLRAAVDDPRTAAGLGIPIDRIFSLTFALGSALAGLGGALGVEVLGLDPTFPLKYIVYFLLVVSIAGAGASLSTAVAASVLGVCDIAGKYYLPELGAFIIYGLMIVLLLAFPAGLARGRAR
jgi:branched-chain amino acid transport system permease protein